MPDFFAIKKLAGSDLGWFKSLYHKFTNTNLKGINLNADVLVDVFYRDLPVIAAATKNQVKVGITIYGPGAAAAYPGTFKMVKSGNSKNWRLNGMLVDDPLGERGRFDALAPNDIGVFAFAGRPAPTDMQLVLLAKGMPQDAVMHSFFESLIPGTRKTMVAVTPTRIAEALALPGVPADHPLSWLVSDPETEEALEDAVRGGLRGLRSLWARRSGRPVTREEFEEARKGNEKTGDDGEALVNDYLTTLQNPGGSWDFDWVSTLNPFSPFDFRCRSLGGSMGNAEFVLDVKSTKGAFNADFHMSIGELVHAAKSDVPYFIYRVFNLNSDGGTLQISEDIRPLAAALLDAHDKAMPSGVTADSFSISVSLGISWGKPVTISFRAADEDSTEQQ